MTCLLQCLHSSIFSFPVSPYKIIFACTQVVYTKYAELLFVIRVTEKSKKHLVLQSFSLSKNVRKLLTFPKTSDNLECIHGMKFISMCFIIVGHRFMFSLGSPIMNTNFIEYVSKLFVITNYQIIIILYTFYLSITVFLIGYNLYKLYIYLYRSIMLIDNDLIFIIIQ